jgi:hypothetical protein
MRELPQLMGPLEFDAGSVVHFTDDSSRIGLLRPGTAGAVVCLAAQDGQAVIKRQSEQVA